MSEINEIGKRYGRWSVVGAAPPATSGGKKFRRWMCVCECGTRRPVTQLSLRSGKSQSCGCLNKEASSRTHTTHGDTESVEYNALKNIISRCENPKNKRFHDYGGRGISVCPEWRHDYAAFLAHVGRRPTPKHTLDRIDNEKNYEPGNMKWSTPHEQMTNRRCTRFVETPDGPVPLATLAREHKIPANTLRARVLKGWSLEAALSTPVREKMPNGLGRRRDLA